MSTSMQKSCIIQKIILEDQLSLLMNSHTVPLLSRSDLASEAGNRCYAPRDEKKEEYKRIKKLIEDLDKIIVDDEKRFQQRKKA